MTKVLVYEVEIKGVKTAVNSQADLARAIRDTTKARQAEKFNTDEYKRLGNQIAALKARGAIVIAPEIFGVNSHIRAVTDGYAADGYLAIAPALFDRAQRGYDTGYSPEEIQAGVAVMQKVSLDDALRDVQACVTHVASAGKVGIVGYCWGGTVAWVAAAKVTASSPDKTRFAAMAKKLASDNGSSVVDRALQMFGGYGYLRDYPIERFWRDLRVHRILEGTNEVMKMIVGRDLLK